VGLGQLLVPVSRQPDPGHRALLGQHEMCVKHCQTFFKPTNLESKLKSFLIALKQSFILRSSSIELCYHNEGASFGIVWMENLEKEKQQISGCSICKCQIHKHDVIGI
jgi:hypothetical protein